MVLCRTPKSHAHPGNSGVTFHVLAGRAGRALRSAGTSCAPALTLRFMLPRKGACSGKHSSHTHSGRRALFRAGVMDVLSPVHVLHPSAG